MDFSFNLDANSLDIMIQYTHLNASKKISRITTNAGYHQPLEITFDLP